MKSKIKKADPKVRVLVDFRPETYDKLYSEAVEQNRSIASLVDELVFDMLK